MSFYRCMRPATLLGVLILSCVTTAQPLTLRTKPITTVPANVTQQLTGSTNTAKVTELIADSSFLNQSDWQQQLSHIQLQLSDNIQLTVFAKQRTETKQGLIWQGQISGKPNSRVGLVITPKGVSGSVAYDGQLWQIRRLQDGRSIMFATEQALLNADDTVRLTEQQQRQLSASASSAGYTALLPEVTTSATGFTDETRIQVMVYYDIQELETYPDLLELIDLEFLQANNALTNSGVDAQLSAVVKLPVSRQNASRGMLSLMLSGEEMFSNLARDRQRYNADLVHYFGLNLDQWVCGLAYLSAFPEGNAYADWALGVTSTNCLGSLVFAHEVGHNFGAHHDRYVVPDADNDYNYGYVNLETLSQTIMAYSDACNDNGKYCTKAPYFSNPTILFKEGSLGIAAGEPDAADNQKMLNFSALTLANYAGVGAPTGLTASNNNLAQGINVSWQPLPGATEYELFRSTSCDYDSFKTLLVTTTDTSYADADAAGGRYCYFVQGINDNLISGAQRSAISLPESGFGSGPALSKIADQYTDSVDQSVAVTFSSGAVVAPSVEIIQHNLPSEPVLFLQDLGSSQFQLTVSNATNNDGTAIVKVTTDRVFEVFSVSFSGNVNTVPVITAPEQVTFNQQTSTSFNVDILDSQINLTNPIGLLVLSEDARLLPKAAVDYAVNYTDDGAQLTIDINPQHKLFGTTGLNIQVTDGEHLVSQRIEVNIARVLNSSPVVPSRTTMYVDGDKPLQRLLPMYDADNDIMEFTLLNGPTKGLLTINDNAFTYLPDDGFSGEDSFSYRVTELYSGESFDAIVLIKPRSERYLLSQQKLVQMHSLFIFLDYSGQLWAWGENIWNILDNDNSELDSNTDVQTSPTPTKLYKSQWADIATTERIILIHQDGSLWNISAETATSQDTVNKPQRIGSDSDWQSIVQSGIGYDKDCILLTKTDGSLWASGICKSLASVDALPSENAAENEPQQINGLYHWVKGMHNGYSTILLDNTGTVWTAAYVRGSEPSLGRAIEPAFLVPISGFLSPVSHIYTGSNYSFALAEEGFYIWGLLPEDAPWFNHEYVLRSSPTLIDTPSFIKFSANSSLLLFLTKFGELWTAGNSPSSAVISGLGRGDFSEPELAKVEFAHSWNQVFAFFYRSFGLSSKGQLWVTGNYDIETGSIPWDPRVQISVFTPITQFDLKQLGYTDTDTDGILDYLETDADNDGIADGWELKYGLDRQNAADAALDNDDDGLSNLQEFELGTNPSKADTDDDTMPDMWELQYGFNPADANDALLDADNDLLSNAEEFQRGTLPNNADTDADGLPDGWEVQYGLNPVNQSDAAVDTDNDGLSNLQEFELGTNPTKADSDNDAMPDGWELQYGFNPTDASDAALDADNDQLSNAAEFQRGTLPNNADTDADGMPDGWEVQYGLNPVNAADASSDNDADGATALQEFQNGTNPNVKNNSSNGNTTPPPEQKSSGGSMPITALLSLLVLLTYRRRFVR